MTTPIESVNEHSTTIHTRNKPDHGANSVNPYTNDRISPASLARNFFSITISTISARFHPGLETMQLQAIFVSRDDSTGRYIDSGAIRQSNPPDFAFPFSNMRARRHTSPPLCFLLSIFLFPTNGQIPRGALSQRNDSTTDNSGAVFFVARGKLNFHVATLWPGVPRYSS